MGGRQTVNNDGTDSQFRGDRQLIQGGRTANKVKGKTDDCNKNGAYSAHLLQRVAIFIFYAPLNSYF